VDNFDQALNPRLAKAVASLFVELMLKTERQAILTTHNPAVLDALDISDDRVRLFAVDRNRQGATTVRRIEVNAKVIAKRKMPLSRLWVEGRLGAVPNL